MEQLVIWPRRFETGRRPQETDHEESRADKGETQIRLLDGHVAGSIKHDNNGDWSPSEKAQRSGYYEFTQSFRFAHWCVHSIGHKTAHERRQNSPAHMLYEAFQEPEVFFVVS